MFVIIIKYFHCFDLCIATVLQTSLELARQQLREREALILTLEEKHPSRVGHVSKQQASQVMTLQAELEVVKHANTQLREQLVRQGHLTVFNAPRTQNIHLFSFY